MESSIFAIRFRKAMDEKHLRQIELVRLAQEQGIKLGKSQLSQYLSGKTLPRKNILRFLADADLALLCAPAGRCPLAERAADAERWALAGRLVPEVLFREGSALRLEELALVSLLMIIST